MADNRTSKEQPESPIGGRGRRPQVLGLEPRSPIGEAPEVLDVRRASHIVGLSPSTLNTLRSRGGGPPYVKMGRRVFYRVKDLRAWRDARLRSSTAE